jgi:hypothetical protein
MRKQRHICNGDARQGYGDANKESLQQKYPHCDRMHYYSQLMHLCVSSPRPVF